MATLSEEILKILVAALMGAVMGIERQWKGKPAGFRTLMLVSAGSALFTIMSYRMVAHFGPGAPSRIASNILPGIGFIGAGIIFRGSNGVHGLTTAATVWCAAAIGMTVGNGEYLLAVLATLLVWLILAVLYKAEELLEQTSQVVVYNIGFKDAGQLPGCEEFFEGSRYKLIDMKFEKKESGIAVHWTIRARQRQHEAAMRKLIRDERISYMKHT